MSVRPGVFREALGRFASGVCVVTSAGEGGRPVGVTISSFASLSLDPPLVLFCIGKRSANLAAWLSGARFCVNVLGGNQEEISERFAAQTGEKFSGVAGTAGADGCFRIHGCLAALACRRTSLYDEGDHYIVVGAVEDVVFGDDQGPLLRFRGRYRVIGGDPAAEDPR